MYAFTFVVLEHLKTFSETLKKTILQTNKSKKHSVLLHFEIKLNEFVHFNLKDYVDNQ